MENTTADTLPEAPQEPVQEAPEQQDQAKEGQVQGQEKEQAQETRRTPTAHAVVRNGALVSLHRSVRDASVAAWRLALRDAETPAPKYAVQAWEYGASAPKDAWRVDSARAVKANVKDAAVRWLNELDEKDRVPRVLWNSYMVI